MSKYLVEKDGEYINIYKNDILYQQHKLPESEELRGTMLSQLTKYYKAKEEREQNDNFNKKESEPMNAVEHPSHYNMGNIEVIDAIDDWQLNFSLGNAVKYIARAGHKDANKKIEDLEKAIWYIKHEIEILKKPTEVSYEDVCSGIHTPTISELSEMFNER